MVIIEHLPSRISSRQIPTTSNLRNKKSSNRKKNCKPSIITKLVGKKAIQLGPNGQNQVI